MEIAVVADTHFGCRGDSEVFLNQHRLFFENVFFPELKKRGISTIIHLGDLFDKTKTVNFKTLGAVRNFFIDPIVRNKMEMWIIPGNHDCYYRDDSSVTSVETILGGYSNIHVITKPSLESIGHRSFVFLPWQHETELPIDLPTGDVLCTHLSMIGYEMHKGYKSLDHGIDPALFRGFPLVISGDFHHPNGPYIGAPIEIKWDDFGGPRGFSILDTKTLTLDYIKNPNRVFRKLNYDDTNETLETILAKDFSIFKGICVRIKVKACKDPYLLDQFVKKIEEQNPFSVNVIEVKEGDVDIENVGTIDHSQNPLDIIKEFIMTREVVDKKDDVFSYMSDLYHKTAAAELHSGE